MAQSPLYELGPDVGGYTEIEKLLSDGRLDGSKPVPKIAKVFKILYQSLTQPYYEKRSIFRRQGRGDRELNGFTTCSQLQDIIRLSLGGLQAKNSKLSLLGDPAKGVYLCTHSDVAYEKLATDNPKADAYWMLICKYLPGRELVVENKEEETGASDYDSVRFSSVPQPTDEDCYERAQIYLQEKNALGAAVSRPRHCLPYAAVLLTESDVSKHDYKPIIDTCVRRVEAELDRDIAIEELRHEGPSGRGLLGAPPIRDLMSQSFGDGDGLLGAPGNRLLGATGDGLLGAPGDGLLGAPGDRLLGAPGDRLLGAPGDGLLGAPGDGILGAPGNRLPATPGDGLLGAPPSLMGRMSVDPAPLGGDGLLGPPPSALPAARGAGILGSPPSLLDIDVGQPQAPSQSLQDLRGGAGILGAPPGRDVKPVLPERGDERVRGSSNAPKEIHRGDLKGGAGILGAPPSTAASKPKIPSLLDGLSPAPVRAREEKPKKKADPRQSKSTSGRMTDARQSNSTSVRMTDEVSDLVARGNISEAISMLKRVEANMKRDGGSNSEPRKDPSALRAGYGLLGAPPGSAAGNLRGEKAPRKTRWSNDQPSSYDAPNQTGYESAQGSYGSTQGAYGSSQGTYGSTKSEVPGNNQYSYPAQEKNSASNLSQYDMSSQYSAKQYQSYGSNEGYGERQSGYNNSAMQGQYGGEPQQSQGNYSSSQYQSAYNQGFGSQERADYVKQEYQSQHKDSYNGSSKQNTSYSTSSQQGYNSVYQGQNYGTESQKSNYSTNSQSDYKTSQGYSGSEAAKYGTGSEQQGYSTASQYSDQATQQWYAQGYGSSNQGYYSNQAAYTSMTPAQGSQYAGYQDTAKRQAATSYPDNKKAKVGY